MRGWGSGANQMRSRVPLTPPPQVPSARATDQLIASTKMQSYLKSTGKAEHDGRLPKEELSNRTPKTRPSASVCLCVNRFLIGMLPRGTQGHRVRLFTIPRKHNVSYMLMGVRRLIPSRQERDACKAKMFRVPSRHRRTIQIGNRSSMMCTTADSMGMAADSELICSRKRLRNQAITSPALIGLQSGE